MSFLKGLKKTEPKIVKQKEGFVKQTPKSFKQEEFELNPKVKTIDDIPNTNIMTSGKLIGIRLRANKEIMLKNLKEYIEGLIKNERKKKS
nr:MAG: hypothetical protein [uncultured archaeon]